jgi:hypothetical protein
LKINKWLAFLLTGIIFTTVLVCSCSGTPDNQTSVPPTVPTTTHPPVADTGAPAAPQQLKASKVTANSTALTWADMSDNEDGFQLNCGSDETIILPAGTTYHEDTGLKPATTYVYQVKARNEKGLSGPTTLSVSTPNPSVKLVLDRIGVHDNGESGMRDTFGTGNGEIQVGVIVTDGKSTVKKVYPASGHYSLKIDEAVEIGDTVFQTAEVGDSLRVVFTAYEDDGGLGEQVLYNALEFAIKTYIGPGASIALSLSGIDLSAEIGGLFGQESDWLGTYDKQWTLANNWGVGNYVDVDCPIGDGKIGLRLWFAIE